MRQDNTVVTSIYSLATGERRSHRRVDVSMSVKEIGSCERYMRATSLGVGGLYCPEALPRPVGSRLLVEISLEGRRPPMVVSAKVCRAGDGIGGRGVALKFCGGPQSQLRCVVKEILRGSVSHRL